MNLKSQLHGLRVSNGCSKHDHSTWHRSWRSLAASGRRWGRCRGDRERAVEAEPRTALTHALKIRRTFLAGIGAAERRADPVETVVVRGAELRFASIFRVAPRSEHPRRK